MYRLRCVDKANVPGQSADERTTQDSTSAAGDGASYTKVFPPFDKAYLHGSFTIAHMAAHHFHQVAAGDFNALIANATSRLAALAAHMHAPVGIASHTPGPMDHATPADVLILDSRRDDSSMLPVSTRVEYMVQLRINQTVASMPAPPAWLSEGALTDFTSWVTAAANNVTVTDAGLRWSWSNAVQSHADVPVASSDGVLPTVGEACGWTAMRLPPSMNGIPQETFPMDPRGYVRMANASWWEGHD
jgi:hypothetical protein